MEKITVKIDGMMCGMCESHMNDTFRQNFKVKKVSSSHAKGETVAIVDEDIPDEKLKEAVEKMFEGTKVKSVNTMNLDGKTKRRGMTYGKTAKTKKAIVQLTAESADIEIFEGL